MKHFFLNYKIDKQELKRLLTWFFQKYGAAKTSRFADTLKYIGFHYAMEAGISIGIDDLEIPELKSILVTNARSQVAENTFFYERGEITAVEKFRKVIDTWAWTSESVKKEVISNFSKQYPLNPVYMMASSGARGNMAQVRQLVGMRGLMSDPKGDLLDLPIQTNFREGLTVVEYIISCYGSRKGVVDTALRTANSGYLTRRLIEVSQEISINTICCSAKRGIPMMALLIKNYHKKFVSKYSTISKENIVISLETRLVGRVLSKTIHPTCAPANKDITPNLAQILSSLYDKIFIRSPFTCETNNKNICQLCYGWNLAESKIVSIGDAVGVFAAQSIGEPGTQLTMRTFHTGGVFSGTVGDKMVAPCSGYVAFRKTPGKLIRTRKGERVFFNYQKLDLALIDKHITFLQIPAFSFLFIFPGQYLNLSHIIAECPPKYKIEDEKETTYVDKLKILSTHNGQIFFEDLHLVSFINKKKPPIAYQHGCIWIISGEIFYLSDKFYQGDFIRKYVYKGVYEKYETIEFRTFEKKNLFLTVQNYLYSFIPLEIKSLNKSTNFIKIGEYISMGEKFGINEKKNRNKKEDLTTDTSGLIFQIKKSKTGYIVYMREISAYAVGKGAAVFVENNSIVSTGHTLFVLQYTREKTGDIVQGLPKIEQLFEARTKKGFDILLKNPKNIALSWFFSLRSNFIGFNQATLISLQVVQYFLLNGIQRVYWNQGVNIADKHLELIIKEMCSIVLIIEGGLTPFVPGEILNHEYIRTYNSIEPDPAIYIPLITGITKLGLIDESFLSAASFQQTRKVLMNAALHIKRDRLAQMKQAVMVGKLIPVGSANIYVLRKYIENIRDKIPEDLSPQILLIQKKKQSRIEEKKRKESLERKKIAKLKRENKKLLKLNQINELQNDNLNESLSNDENFDKSLLNDHSFKESLPNDENPKIPKKRGPRGKYKKKIIE